MRRIVTISRTAGPCDDYVRLDHDLRSRRRMVFHTDSGEPILLDLERPANLKDGDRLALDDGHVVQVTAAAEALIEICAPSIADLVRIAWHLGNRHLATQLVPGSHGGTLRIREDHVISGMVSGLGGLCTSILAPFDPEGGAYGSPTPEGHKHNHNGQHHG